MLPWYRRAMNHTLKELLCPHRGIGEENSLSAIENAIKTKPFMVEFDIQQIDDTFFLGHPPKLNRKATLNDALLLFKNSVVMPKIDVKCSLDWKSDLNQLLEILKNYEKEVLINVGGEKLSPNEYIDAEKLLMEKSENNILLNVDVLRYGRKSKSKISNHLNSMKRKPFSVSPLLEGRIKKEVEIALDCGINNIHFWSNNSRKYRQKELLEIYAKYSRNNVCVLFDINPKIVVDA